ncbi:MAG: 30S ribosomal protein S16 [Candidatus Omnitrophica bacterium]|nr:30S ribosomal protein S16 [Candidatus Omnitrophota bacterium]
MVVIRFQRLGTRKTPYHRIIVTDRRQSQASQVLEVLGYYDPSTKPARFSVDHARVAQWVSKGARVSESLQRLLKRSPKSAAAN